ncbi:MAG: hypothetical protein HYV45_02495 [Candidatus Moranbacteria bacterium]|nr:hypothetical protein [Candidatus Moranbacteria bacterium]
MFFYLESVFLWVVVFLLFFIGSFVLYKDRKDRPSQSFALVSFSMMFWIIMSYFEDGAFDLAQRILFVEADFSFGILSSFFIFIFCADMARLSFITKKPFRSLLMTVPILFSALIFFTDIIISTYHVSSYGIIEPVFSNMGMVYNFAVSFFLVAGVGIIFWKYNTSDIVEKTRYIYLLIGLSLAIIIVLVTNVFPSEGIKSGPYYQFFSRLGVFSTIFVVLFPGYAIIRHRLFNVRILATEILSFGILLILFVQIFLSNGWYQMMLRLIVFVIVLVLISILMKSVEGEIHRKEELQRISDSLAIANERLKELDNAKSEFISIASHQLRTPLTAIKGYVSLILEGSYGKIPVSVEDVLEKVYLVNGRLVQLVEDLLNVSRIESGRVRYQFVSTELVSLITDVVDIFRLQAKAKQLDLVIQPAKETVPKMTLDINKIKEVLSNLIDNAIKYTTEGNITVSIHITENAVQVVVSDTGIGFSSEQKERLFQKFVRSKETIKLVTSGSGLGLYVGKNFVEAHGGKIWAESEGPGKGAKFIVELPFVNPHALQEDIDSFKESYRG